MSLRDIYAQYNERIQIQVIYIREAHAMDGWDIGSEVRTNDPTTIEERRELASQCELALSYGIKTYVDEMDDPVMTAYAAWPERLYLVGVDGTVEYKGARGPGGFNPGELKEAIDRVLARAES